MRLMPLISTALALSISGTSFAQEWIEFASRADRFTRNFPSQPKVTETTYRSEYGADLPARVYSATQGQSRYSMTVVEQSLGWLDENGIGLRYQSIYSNGFPAPPRVNRAVQPGQGRIDAPGASPR